MTLSPVVLPPLGNKPGTSPMMAIPLQVEEEPVWAEPLPDDAGFDVVPDDEPVLATPLIEANLNSRPTSPSKPISRTATASHVNPADESMTEDQPKKKKKKKKLPGKSETSLPMWMWIAGGLGALVTTAGLVAGVYLLMRMNTPDGQAIDWGNKLLLFAINIPITLVILIIGMFLSSALGGGINFGEAKTAIIGAIFLIVIVNLVYMIPVAGPYLTLLVWLVGFMTIFGLDPWEARFLFFIVWVMHYFLNMAIVHYMFQRAEREFKMMEEGIEDELPRNRKRNNGKRNQKQQKEMDPEDDTWGHQQPDQLHDLVREWVARRYA